LSEATQRTRDPQPSGGGANREPICDLLVGQFLDDAQLKSVALMAWKGLNVMLQREIW
jgi:hypothetical protein